jgi:hypothetical protein
VVTLMLDEQVSDVRQLTRKAGVKPTITRFSGASHPVLHEIAPGERKFGQPVVASRPEPARPQQPRRGRKPNPRNHAGGSGRGSGRSGGRSQSVASFSANMSRGR